MAEEALIVLATFPDTDTARRIVQALVSEKLAACGNIIPGVESIYRWAGKVETSAEVLAVLKTEIARYQQLEMRLKELHPYEVPECLVLRVADGLPAYLRWLGEAVR